MSVFNSQTMVHGQCNTSPYHGQLSSQISVTNVLFFFLAHVPLALLMVRFPDVGRIHAWATVLVGASWAVNGSHPSRVLSAAAYIAGSEVLWRMTNAPIFWEFGKYAVVAVLLLAIQRTRPLRATNFPIVFFALLVPSIAMTITGASPERIRHDLSFNLSGPLALAVCAAYCSRVQLTVVQVQRILIAFLGPVVAIVIVIFFHFSQVENISFGSGSSHLASGGYGPNQVSAVLGFGALAAFLLAVMLPLRRSRGFQRLMLVFVTWLAAQSVLTLSRSGLYLGVAGIGAAACFGIRDARLRTGVLVASVFLYIVGVYVVAPRLDALTDGAISKRFADTDLTGRNRIMQSDIALWAKHPLLGVGPGMSARDRGEYFRAAVAHTELTRLVSEHGLLGAAAIGMLLVTSWQALRRPKSRRWKAFVASMIVYGFLFMGVNGMRLVLPSFTIGLAFAAFTNEQTSPFRR